MCVRVRCARTLPPPTHLSPLKPLTERAHDTPYTPRTPQVLARMCRWADRWRRLPPVDEEALHRCLHPPSSHGHHRGSHHALSMQAGIPGCDSPGGSQAGGLVGLASSSQLGMTGSKYDSEPCDARMIQRYITTRNVRSSMTRSGLFEEDERAWEQKRKNSFNFSRR